MRNFLLAYAGLLTALFLMASYKGPQRGLLTDPASLSDADVADGAVLVITSGSVYSAAVAALSDAQPGPYNLSSQTSWSCLAITDAGTDTYYLEDSSSCGDPENCGASELIGFINSDIGSSISYTALSVTGGDTVRTSRLTAGSSYWVQIAAGGGGSGNLVSALTWDTTKNYGTDASGLSLSLPTPSVDVSRPRFVMIISQTGGNKIAVDLVEIAAGAAQQFVWDGVDWIDL